MQCRQVSRKCQEQLTLLMVSTIILIIVAEAEQTTGRCKKKKNSHHIIKTTTFFVLEPFISSTLSKCGTDNWNKGTEQVFSDYIYQYHEMLTLDVVRINLRPSRPRTLLLKCSHSCSHNNWTTGKWIFSNFPHAP